MRLSKFARALEILARQPQPRERLTSQRAEVTLEMVELVGAALVADGEHLCMTLRGIKKASGRTITSDMRGVFAEQAATRSGCLTLIRALAHS